MRKTRQILLNATFIGAFFGATASENAAFVGTASAKTPGIVGEFFVSPNGNDSNDGTESAPFATLERARDAVRNARTESAKSSVDGVYQIRLGEGEFRRTAPFELDVRDSKTRFVGVPGKTTVFGGREIGGWRPATNAEKSAFPNSDGEVWRAELPKIDGEPIYFEQLFVAERRATRARFPNGGDFLRPASVWEESPMDPATRRAPTDSTPQELRAKPGDLDSLRLPEIPAAELRFAQFVVHHHWDTTRRVLLGFAPERNALLARGGAMKSWNPWRDSSLYYLENLRTAFDAPGEWFYAGAENAVYYRPLDGETLDATRFVAPVAGLSRLLIVAGTQNKKVVDIRFDNISFAYTDSPRLDEHMRPAGLDVAITGDLSKPGPSQFEPAQSAFFTRAVLTVNDAENIVFDGCKVAHVGEYGLWFKNCSDCALRNSDLYDLGAGGVRVGGGNLDVRNVVENCWIAQGGRFHASATAVWVGQNTEEIAILHNDISDFYYTGVSVGWVWGYDGGRAFRNRIEFNRIHKIGQGKLADMGGVYTLGTQTGSRVCNNVIFDVESYGYGGWGLYPDEGSEGILFENNLVYDCMDGSFHQHYGKNNVVRNNILARSKANPAKGGPAHQVAITRIEPHLSIVFERNVVYWKDGVAFGYNADKAKAEYRSNLWFNAGGEATFAGKTRDAWAQESGQDAGGLVADPKFVDPDANDFRLKPGSPAEKIGFVPFDYSQAGPDREPGFTR